MKCIVVSDLGYRSFTRTAAEGSGSCRTGPGNSRTGRGSYEAGDRNCPWICWG